MLQASWLSPRNKIKTASFICLVVMVNHSTHRMDGDGFCMQCTLYTKESEKEEFKENHIGCKNDYGAKKSVTPGMFVFSCVHRVILDRSFLFCYLEIIFERDCRASNR